MTQLIAQYRTREAIVSIVKSDGGFRVQMDRLTVRGGSEHRAYPIEELDSAVVRAQAIVSKISGYSIEEKCAFGNNRTKHLCNANNCPHELGGQRFWQMFRRLCPYRSR